VNLLNQDFETINSFYKCWVYSWATIIKTWSS